MLKRHSRLDKCLKKLVDTRNRIGLMLETLRSTNHQISLVQTNNLTSVVRAMNTLVPMVHRMGSEEFEKAAIQLFVIYNDDVFKRCALEENFVWVNTN